MSLLLSTLQTDLSKEQSRDPHPDPERCRDLLHELLSQLSKVAATVDHNDSLEKQDSMALRKTLTACEKSFRLCKRRASNRTDDPYKMNTILVWHDLLALVARVTSTLDANKKVAAAAAAATVERRDEICHTTTTTKSGTTSGMTLPLSVSEYRTRLQRHQKELYKDPPVLPPIPVTFSKPCTKAPRRDATTKRLTFFATTTMADEEDPHPTTTGRKGQSESRVVPDFHPNQTPKEILQGGAFGGTYFRPIHSAVTNQSYSNSMSVLDSTVDSSWIAGLDCNRFLTSTSYDVSVNKFNAKCGGSLGMWEVRPTF